MEYAAYARPVLRRWPLILVLALLAAGAAYAVSARAPRQFRATAQLSVTPSVVEFFTGEAVQRLLSNYALQLRSRLFAAEYGRRLQPPQSGDQLAGRVRAVAAPSEFRIAIEVDDGDPQRAAEIANAAAAAFVDRITAENVGRERRDLSISILEWADVPGAPFSPRPRRDALGAAILGSMIGVALAFLLEFWDDTVKTADEAAKLLAIPVLGAIPNRAATTKRGVLDGLRGRGRRARRGTTGRDRLHKAALAAGGGVPHTPH